MNRKDLLEALDKVGPGLSPKESIEQSDCYIFKDGLVITFNDEIAVSFPLDIKISGAINAKKFYDIISKLKDQDIGLSIVEGELRINGKKGRGGIRVQEEIELPMEEFSGEKEWIPIAHGFAEAVKFCLYTVSKDESMGILTGVHINQYFVESTDNFRVSRKFYSELEIPFDDFIIPAASGKQLINYDLSDIYVDRAWAHFRSADNATISCRIYNEDYPNLDRFLANFDGTDIELPEDFAAAVVRAGVFSDVDDEASIDRVKVTIGDDKIKIRGEGEIGWFEDECDLDYDDKEIEFYSSPKHLVDMFDITKNITVGDTLIRFEEPGNFIYITAMISEE